MPITLNETVIDNCDGQSTLTWENDTNNPQAAGNLGPGETGDNAITPREGTGTVEFDYGSAGNATLGIRKISTITPFSVRSNEVGVWFLNPKQGADDD